MFDNWNPHSFPRWGCSPPPLRDVQNWGCGISSTTVLSPLFLSLNPEGHSNTLQARLQPEPVGTPIARSHKCVVSSSCNGGKSHTGLTRPDLDFTRASFSDFQRTVSERLRFPRFCDGPHIHGFMIAWVIPGTQVVLLRFVYRIQSQYGHAQNVQGNTTIILMRGIAHKKDRF